MRYRRCALGTYWLGIGTIAGVAVVAAGCVGPLTGPAAGLVELEPHKARDAKVAKPTKEQGDPGAATAESVPIISKADDPNQPPAGSGFPPLGTAHAAASGDADLAALAAEMQTLGTLSPVEQKALLADLKQSDPTLWPQLVRQFRAVMAYRRRQGSGVGDQGSENSEAVSPSINGSAASLATRDGASVEPAASEKTSQPISAPRSRDTTADSAPPKATGTPTADVMPTQPPLRPPLKATKRAPSELANVKSSESSSTNADSKTAPETRTDSEHRQVELTKTILAMEGESAANTAAADEIARQIRLRMMYLAAGRRDDALRPIPGLSAGQQEFWNKEIYGLATYLDADKAGDHERQAAEAALHLREAASRIGEFASPVVRNLAFCKEVTSFGVFKRFPKDEFKAGDEALLYCEIENLKADSTDKGYRTSVKSSYQILDAHGERMAEQEFPASEDLCTSQRRDFFIPYFIWVPKRIDPGTYTLQLTVEDTQTHKTGQASIQFAVK